jgi:hypothetical protein
MIVELRLIAEDLCIKISLPGRGWGGANPFIPHSSSKCTPFSPAFISTSRIFSKGGNGQVAYGVKAHGGL